MDNNTKKNDVRSESRPEWLAIKAFGLAILAGALLLCLPFANTEGRWTNPIDSFFTSTSATCVTGLTVKDTGGYFSVFGQIVILLLIQLGGLGIMTLGTFLLVLAGRRLRMEDEFVLMDSLGREKVRGLKSLLVRAVLLTFSLEATGAAILSYRLIAVCGYPAGKAVYHGIFHSISAFCNAGFSLYPDSLTGMRTDPVFLLTIMGLVVLGGLGFLVLHNLSSVKFWHKNKLLRGRLTLHSRIVLLCTPALILGGWLIFLVLEWNQTLADMRFSEKIISALFQSVTPRTAGFNVVAIADMKPVTHLFTMVLMFIGGSPASTAGGIKTTTLFVLFLTVVAMIRGREDAQISGRTVPMSVVREATAIFVLAVTFVSMFFGLLLLTEHLPILRGGIGAPDALFFETISAFGTVGLSTGITSSLSLSGKLCIILCMFIGRLGPLTVALIIGTRDMRQIVRYPTEEVIVG